MNLIRLLFMVLSPTIKNIELPVCKNCIHFLPFHANKPEDMGMLGKCNMYGTKNIITGAIHYEFAEHARQNLFQCGQGGGNYEEKVIQNVPK